LNDGATTSGGGAHAPRTVSERLADHVHGVRFEDLPEPVVAKTKDLLLHHLGVAFRGHGDSQARRAVQFARSLSGSNTECSVIGERDGASLLDAVFVNALLMGCLELDDFQLPPGVQQGVVTHPVALAFGEQMHAPGRELIAALVVGYDVVAKLASPMSSWELQVPKQWFSLYGTFGSAAVAARLLNLSRDETACALAHAAHLGVGLVEAGRLAVDTIRSMVARNGATAAVLAQAGLPTTLSSIEGQHGLFRSYAGEVPDGLDECLSTLGEVFEITKASPKRYRVGANNIVPQELTLEMLTTYSLGTDDIARVDVILPTEREGREMVMETRLKSASEEEEAGWSVRFLLAIVVATGTIDPTRYELQHDVKFQEVLDKIHLRFERGRPLRYCRIEITTVASDLRAAEGDDHVFPPVDPYSWLAEGGQGLVSDAQLRRLVKLIDELEYVDDVRELTACVSPKSSGPA
jgi:2-methylcitrate dehydratase PrpD